MLHNRLIHSLFFAVGGLFLGSLGKPVFTAEDLVFAYICWGSFYGFIMFNSWFNVKKIFISKSNHQNWYELRKANGQKTYNKFEAQEGGNPFIWILIFIFKVIFIIIVSMILGTFGGGFYMLYKDLIMSTNN